jgi:hypothetical protein
MVNFPHGSTVTVIRRTLTGRDVKGNDVYSEARQDVGNCSVQGGASTEVAIGTEQITSDVVVYMPEGIELDALDVLEIDGLRYEIQGEPSHYQSSFTGTIGPVQIRANRMTGVAV